MRLIALVLFTVMTTPAVAQNNGDGFDYRNALDQAKFFIRKGWLHDAEEQLLLSSEDPNGRLDPEVWYLLAHVAFEQCDIAATRQAISAAHTHARDTNQLTQIDQMEQAVSEPIGWLRLPKRNRADFKLEMTSPLFNPTLKQYLNRVQERLATNEALPDRLGLPVGQYRCGTWRFRVSKVKRVRTLRSKRLYP